MRVEVGATAGRSRASIWHFVAASLISLAGLADAVYLTIEHMTGAGVRCLVVRGCDEVLMSAYATLPGGIPLAGAGAAAYFAVFSAAVLAAFGYKYAAEVMAIVVAGMFLFTLWLLFVQAFVLDAFCSYCLLSATLVTSLAAISLHLFWPVLQRRRLIS